MSLGHDQHIPRTPPQPPHASPRKPGQRLSFTDEADLQRDQYVIHERDMHKPTVTLAAFGRAGLVMEQQDGTASITLPATLEPSADSTITSRSATGLVQRWTTAPQSADSTETVRASSNLNESPPPTIVPRTANSSSTTPSRYAAVANAPPSRRATRTTASTQVQPSQPSTQRHGARDFTVEVQEPSGRTANEVAHDERVEEAKRRSGFWKRLRMALFGGLSLIVPMIIMSIHSSTKKSLITSCCFVLGFAVGMAATTAARDAEMIAGTAAYAAVMVVFVGVTIHA